MNRWKRKSLLDEKKRNIPSILNRYKKNGEKNDFNHFDESNLNKEKISPSINDNVDNEEEKTREDEISNPDYRDDFESIEYVATFFPTMKFDDELRVRKTVKNGKITQYLNKKNHREEEDTQSLSSFNDDSAIISEKRKDIKKDKEVHFQGISTYSSSFVETIDTNKYNCETTTQYIDFSECIFCAKYLHGFTKDLVFFVKEYVSHKICGKPK